MEIHFQSKKLRKTCNDFRRLQKEYGQRQAKLIRRRLDELRAANVLAHIRHLPQARCHELHGDRKGQLAVDLKHPYRLIFEPYHDPIPRKQDQGLDWAKVTTILIIGVEDYHG